MKKLLVTVLVCAVGFISVAARPVSEPPLTVADKAAIVKTAMKIKLDRNGPTEFGEFRIFAATNMSPALLPQIPGYCFTLMSEDQIRRNVRRRLIFRYLRIGPLSGDADHVTLKLGIVETRGGLGYHVHSYEYAFTRTGDQWQGKLVMVIC
jgi:hypothetical protein